MRLFVALDLPEVVKDQLTVLHERRLSGARWTTRDQWHITLHFLGERDDEPAIRAALQTVHAASFELALSGVGTFPERGKPRVLWAGIQAPAALQALYQQTGDALRSCGFEPDTRPYSPHLTLARFKDEVPSRDALAAYLERHRAFRSEEVDMTHFTLYESKLDRMGATYHIRERVALDG